MVAPLLEESYLTTVATSVPTVMIGRHDRDCGYDTVNNDDRNGARLAVEHLISLGHRSIAYFGLEPASAAPNNSTALRLVGYRETMMAHGLADVYFGFRRQPFSRRAKRRGSGPSHPKERATPDSRVLLDGYGGVHIDGRGAEARHPNTGRPLRWSVTTTRVSPRLPQISLTSIDQSGHLLGSEAMKLLIERIEGRRTDRHIILPPRLDAKGSTTQAPART